MAVAALQRSARPSRLPSPLGAGSHAHLPTLRCRRWALGCRAAAQDGDKNIARAAARRAVDAFVESGSTVGLGNGRMVLYALEHLAERLQQGLLTDVKCLSACTTASVEAAVHGIPVRSFADGAEADVTLLQADEVDCEGASLALITGRAQADAPAQQPNLPLLRRLLAGSAQAVALVPSPDMAVRRLGGAVPVAVGGERWEDAAEELDDRFLGDAEIWRRPREGTADPRGGDRPYLSKEGHAILDVRFLSTLKLDGRAAPYARIAQEVEGCGGVVAHGLVLAGVGAAVVAYGQEARIVEKGLLLGFKDGQ